MVYDVSVTVTTVSGTVQVRVSGRYKLTVYGLMGLRYGYGLQAQPGVRRVRGQDDVPDDDDESPIWT